MYISTSEGLREFLERIGDAKVVAVDTEFLRERTFYPKLCLVQVAAENPDGIQIGVIDPLLIDDLSGLCAVLTDQRVTKVFHACGQDLEVLFDSLGLICAPVFDTQVAAAFLGMRQQISYGALVERFTGVRLPKAESLTDWSHRPLDPEQLTYAEDDVRYLPKIYEQMMSRLVELDRLGWVEANLAEVCDPSRIQRDPRDAYLRLHRSGSLTSRQLAVAREVCAWRERAAARRDIPRRWLVSDEVIVEVCRRMPQTTESLHKIRGTEQISAADSKDIVDAVARGMAVPEADCPRTSRRTHPSVEVESVIDLMYSLVRVVSEQTGVAAQLLATRDDLAEFVQDRAHSRISRGWRKELLGTKLGRLLDGEVGLTVREGHVEVI